MNAQQIADMLVQATVEYTNIYLKVNQIKKFDKQLWAALHVGFMVGMKAGGYDEKITNQALEIAQENLARMGG